MLGSINLAEFITSNNTFDFESFKETVYVAIRALNDVLDEGLPLHPLAEQRRSVSDWRQIGLGIMGLADLLIKMGIRYGSKEAVDLCDMIGHAMADASLHESALLAKEHGFYPNYSESVMDTAFFTKNALGNTRGEIMQYGLRNSQLLTIAPTGTLSTMLGISGGIEPIFANYYERKTESLHGHDEYYKVYTPIVKTYMEEHNIVDDKDLPDFFVTAQTLDYKERIDMQAIWQNHIDASISSTVNVPNDFTVEQVEGLYMRAWEKGLKGVTIFRDGCKRAGILTASPKEETHEQEEAKGLPRGAVIQVNNDVIGKKRRLTTGCGTLHCIALFDPDSGDLLETYLSKGSSGGCANFMVGLSRMISIAARAGVDVYSIVDQLKSAGTCPSYAVRTATKHDTSKGSCCPVAVGYALVDMYKEVQSDLGLTSENIKSVKKIQPRNNITNNAVKCPSCGETLVFEGGCNVCKACGWSKCL